MSNSVIDYMTCNNHRHREDHNARMNYISKNKDIETIIKSSGNYPHAKVKIP